VIARARGLLLAACLTSAAGAAAGAQAGVPAGTPANPFAISPGPYRAVRVSYASAGANAIGQSSVAMDLVVAPGTMASRSTLTATVNGRATSQQLDKLLTPDSTWEDGVAATAPARVSPAARGALAREFDALDVASRRRLLENLRRLPRDATRELGVLPDAIGTRRGSSTVAGQACDEYEVFGDVICVLAHAPAVPLRMLAKGQLQALTATKVELDAAVAPDELRPPAGRRWTRGECDCAWMEHVWMHGHEDATARPPLRDLVRFAVRWLASPEAAKQLAHASEERP
jgi:hypothetical protein